MNKITEKHIANIIKKHLGFSLLLAVAPVIFFLLIGFFEKDNLQHYPVYFAH